MPGHQGISRRRGGRARRDSDHQPARLAEFHPGRQDHDGDRQSPVTPLPLYRLDTPENHVRVSQRDRAGGRDERAAFRRRQLRGSASTGVLLARGSEQREQARPASPPPTYEEATLLDFSQVDSSPQDDPDQRHGSQGDAAAIILDAGGVTLPAEGTAAIVAHHAATQTITSVPGNVASSPDSQPNSQLEIMAEHPEPGDYKLHLRFRDAASTTASFAVSAREMARNAHNWQLNKDRKGRALAYKLDRFDPAAAHAMRILLSIVHGRTDESRVPATLTFRTLAYLTEMASGFGVRALLRPWIDGWTEDIDPFKPAFFQQPDWPSLLYVASEFNQKKLQSAVVRSMALSCPVDGSGEPITPNGRHFFLHTPPMTRRFLPLLAKVRECRDTVLAKLLRRIHRELRAEEATEQQPLQYDGGPEQLTGSSSSSSSSSSPSSSAGPTLGDRHGLLIPRLHRASLWPLPEPHQVRDSIAALEDKLRRALGGLMTLSETDAAHLLLQDAGDIVTDGLRRAPEEVDGKRDGGGVFLRRSRARLHLDYARGENWLPRSRRGGDLVSEPSSPTPSNSASDGGTRELDRSLDS